MGYWSSPKSTFRNSSSIASACSHLTTTSSIGRDFQHSTLTISMYAQHQLQFLYRRSAASYPLKLLRYDTYCVPNLRTLSAFQHCGPCILSCQVRAFWRSLNFVILHIMSQCLWINKTPYSHSTCRNGPRFKDEVEDEIMQG